MLKQLGLFGVLIWIALGGRAWGQSANIDVSQQGVNGYSNSDYYYDSGDTYLGNYVVVGCDNAYSGTANDPDRTFFLKIEYFNEVDDSYIDEDFATTDVPFSHSAA